MGKNMSQEKIDAYKKEKSERKERIAKQKKRNKILKISGCVVAVAIVATIVGVVLWNNFGSSKTEAAEGASTEISAELTEELDAATEASSAE